MEKYSSFFRLRFIHGLQYRAAAWSGVATQFFWGFMEILMFRAFYKADAAAFPMEFSALVSYVWMQQAFLTLYMSWFMENELFDAIQNGNIAYELCRPVSIYNMWFARGMAYRLSRALLRSMPILAIAVFLPKPYGLRPPRDWNTALWFFITMVLAFLLVIAYGMLVYSITFYTISPMGVKLVSSTLTEFLSGSIIPLPFFPGTVRKVAELLPFASMQNIPLRVYSSDIAGSDIYRWVGMQIFWILVLVAAGRLLFGRALKNMIIQGG